MSLHNTFLRACIALPYDLGPRLVWADYLEGEEGNMVAASRLRRFTPFLMASAKQLKRGRDPFPTAPLFMPALYALKCFRLKFVQPDVMVKVGRNTLAPQTDDLRPDYYEAAIRLELAACGVPDAWVACGKTCGNYLLNWASWLLMKQRGDHLSRLSKTNMERNLVFWSDFLPEITRRRVAHTLANI